MLELLHKKAKNYNFYHAREEIYEKNDNLPFRIAPTPYYLTQEETVEIKEIGLLVSKYFGACSTLCSQNVELKALLNKGKPKFFLNQKITPNYQLIRPDLIYTDQGLIVCEIETSLFGLGLSILLNEGYAEASFKTLVSPKRIKSYFQSQLPDHGEIIYTDKTKAYAEQLAYLADLILSTSKRKWTTKHIGESKNNTAIFRAFYLCEYLTDPKVKKLLDTRQKMNSTAPSPIFPTLSPHMEEKALLALIWDKRYLDFFVNTLGQQSVDKLHKLIPPTFILGQEQYFLKKLPVNNIIDLTDLPHSKRKYALKISGFDPISSWTEGVYFLHELSHIHARTLLQNAINDTERVYVIQEFIPPKKVDITYEDGDKLTHINVGIRITPYYDSNTGELITIKATGCEHTNYIHATSTSINTAVAELPSK